MLFKLTSSLPPSLSHKIYYSLQSVFGRLRKTDPLLRIGICYEILERIQKQGQSHIGKIFFEVGTGRRVVIPIGLWLSGADSIITVDKNPYLSEKLVLKDIDYICKYPEKIKLILGQFSDNQYFDDRIEQLKSIKNINELLNLTNIKYLSNADAADTGLDDKSIDYHISYVVLEHIAADIIKSILKEYKRIIKDDGLFIHCIDFSDHFSHTDKSISSVNFLKFSQQQWDKYALNRYMYQNRLRIDDYINIFEQSGLNILKIDERINQKSLELIQSNNIELDEQFINKPAQVNAATNAWFTAR